MEKDIILEECNQKSSGMTGKHHTEETKKKMSESLKGKHRTEETRKKMSESAKGKIMSEETRKKMSESHEGKHLSEEIKQKISDSEKGKIVTDETKEKISKAKKGKSTWIKGKHLLEETKQKISDSEKGKIVTDETRQKLRISTIKYIELTGPIYPNIGRNETKILDELELKKGYNIIRQFPIGGFFLDGYIPELNLAIEVDEKHHKNQKEKDIQREEFIKKELGCEFLRIKDY